MVDQEKTVIVDRDSEPRRNGTSTATIVAVVVIVLLVLFFLFGGVNMFGGGATPTQIAPTPTTGQ